METISSHLAHVNTDFPAQERLIRVIAQVKMGTASVRNSAKRLPRLCVGRYVQSTTGAGEPRLEFMGIMFKSVLVGGVFNGRIVEYVIKQVNGELRNAEKDEFVVVPNYSIVHDVVFELALESSNWLGSGVDAVGRVHR